MTTASPQASRDALQAELRKQLLEQRAGLTSRHARIDAHLHNADRELPQDWQDRASVIENDEVLEALDVHSRRELDQISAALERMDAGTWGECAACGGEISVGRLKARPMAIRCVDCAE
jgi:RNA polymerase-binding protein DksA